MLPSSPTTTTSISISISLSLFSLFFLTILPTLISALPTPLSPTTSDVEIIAPALQFLPQRALLPAQRMQTEISRPMVIRSEETSDEEGSDDTGPDYEYSKVYSEYATYGQYTGDYDNYPGLTLKGNE
ncbi:uncharacterized protein SEPMUDRAFT_159536 [Sphaerulina musiva SO2202]|uniref:Uncharacterized protein n=1 Tax=Sphaerulina musiva (strain SO2202) TaxID=692275 RepID=M3C7W2_SPHMS|nr:uncharacterized protein SEPMUDRAFT_159536 [Sphaerulina musiva SO2202]EMF07975.1 hypothetical protein SEPMUDRAFT_159536 [Sphaerulina musiva SO2202]